MNDFQEIDDTKRKKELARQTKLSELKCSKNIWDYIDLYQRWNLNFFPVSSKENDRTPLVAWKELQHRKATKEEIEYWYKNRFQGANISIVCGSISDNFVAVDIDDGLYIERFKRAMPNAPIIKTAKGVHFWLKTFKPVKTISLQDENGEELISIRGEGASCTAPPSIHYTDRNTHYTFVNLPADIPMFLGDLIEVSCKITGLEKKRVHTGKPYGLWKRVSFEEVINLIHSKFGEKNE
jgi:hypothetical protein